MLIIYYLFIFLLNAVIYKLIRRQKRWNEIEVPISMIVRFLALKNELFVGLFFILNTLFQYTLQLVFHIILIVFTNWNVLEYFMKGLGFMWTKKYTPKLYFLPFFCETIILLALKKLHVSKTCCSLINMYLIKYFRKVQTMFEYSTQV